MKRLRIKDFGPIVDSGELEIRPVTLLCGHQGSGKSTVAKLISTFSWIEKALVRGDVSPKEITNYKHFPKKYCGYHYLTDYFKKDTFLKYEGDVYRFSYENERLAIEKMSPERNYIIPKIMYVPAERNFLVAMEEAENIRNLPPSLRTLQEEYMNALRNQGKKVLPFGDYTVQYDRLNHIQWLAGKGFKIRMHEAASGFQSTAPLLLVTEYLSKSVIAGEKRPLSLKEEERINKTVDQLVKTEMNDDMRTSILKRLKAMERNDCFWNIIEEPEQNLYPLSQKDVLYKLLEAFNSKEGNGLVITTHSPYILNYLTIAIKADQISKMHGKDNEETRKELNAIVPPGSRIKHESVVVYEITGEGEVNQLATYDGLPSDNNYLNRQLEETNSTFDRLLDLEEKLKK